VAWAEALGHAQSVKLLRQTLEQEKKTDLLLNKLACDEINARAASNGDDDERAGRKAA
jgi:ferritin-like metal-binding protein YciE